MNEEITVSQTLNLSDFLTGAKWHQRRSRWKAWMQWPVAILIVFSIYYTVRIAKGERVDLLVFALSFGCVAILGLCIVYLDQALARHRLKRAFDKQPTQHKTLTWKFQGQGAECSSEGACSLTEWHRFTESVSSSDGMLMYLDKNIFHWLPKTAFASESDYQRFLELAASKTKHSKIG